jgi:hypothetical protein
MPFQKGNKLSVNHGRTKGRQSYAARFTKYADMTSEEMLKINPLKLPAFDGLIIKQWQIAFSHTDVKAALTAQQQFIDRVAGKVPQAIEGSDDENAPSIKIRWED